MVIGKWKISKIITLSLSLSPLFLSLSKNGKISNISFSLYVSLTLSLRPSFSLSL